MNHVIANGVKQSRRNRLTSMEIYFSLSMYQAEIWSSILDELGNCHSLSENESTGRKEWTKDEKTGIFWYPANR